MAYFLKKSNRTRGLYLQIYESFRDKEKRVSVHKSYKTLGYYDDLVKQGIQDPISYFQKEVIELNNKRKIEIQETKTKKISEASVNKNLGYFLIKAMIDKLNIDLIIDILASPRDFQFDISQMIRQLIYARIIQPCSKSKTIEKVVSSLFEYDDISIDQVYDGIKYIGNDYKKYIELFNHQIDKVYGRNTNTVYFDCTYYYFEIDLPKDDKQKCPSKENKKEPIIGQALLLDSNQIPIAMEMYPGNESEKPYIRKLINDMKSKYKITGRTIQVADKGLNCAQNIYEAIKNGDGYVFSKSIHGKNLNDVEKTWVKLEKDYIDINDEKGNLKFKVKECIDEFTYYLTNENGKRIPFKVKEKRIVSYNPTLAKKQKAEINKQIEKASMLNTLKSIGKSEYGDAIKYVNFDGEVTPELNMEKIKEDLSLCGYNLIVTSELDKSALDIYDIYHALWRIEESFRITKSFLEARPVYVRTIESIYGHFLICYLSLVLLRLLEFKVFNNELNSYDIIGFIKNYKITLGPNETYINTSNMSKSLKIIKNKFSYNFLDNLYLTKSNIKKVLLTKV